jgi:two-component system, LytTR family, response regulator
MQINCIVVDDSSIQKLLVSKLSNNHPKLNLVASFSNPLEANNFLKNNHVDLIFLDIEMPVVNGFDFLNGILNKPHVVFITSKSEYAVKAFEYEAIDYLQKPIESERFSKAVNKVIKVIKAETSAIIEEGEAIYIKSNLKKVKVFIEQIKYIEACGDYVKVITNTSSNMVLSTMKGFEEKLPANKFLRIHKSFIVNLERIESFSSSTVQIDSKPIPLSRNRKQDLIDAIDLISKNQ